MVTSVQTSYRMNYRGPGGEEPMEIDHLGDKETRKCYNCDTIGHLARNCCKPKKTKPGVKGARKKPEKKPESATTAIQLDTWPRTVENPRNRRIQ